MLCLSGFEPYSCWVSLYYETCANGNILSLGHLWLDIKCQLIAHSQEQTQISLLGYFFHHCKTTTKNTTLLMGVANIQLLVVSQSTAGLYINLHQKVGHCQPTVTQGQPAVSLPGLRSALGEKSKKRSASKPSQMAVWGGEKAEESFHLPSPPLSCFNSFFFPFSSTMEPGPRRSRDVDHKYWNRRLPLVVYHAQFEEQQHLLEYHLQVLLLQVSEESQPNEKKAFFCKANSLIHLITSFIVKLICTRCLPFGNRQSGSFL